MAVTRAPLDLYSRGTNRRGVLEISGAITVGAAGAVTSVSCEMAPGIAGAVGTAGTILKDAAAGRYNVTFLRRFKGIRFTGCNLTHSGTGAFTGASSIYGRPGLVANQSVTIQGLVGLVDTDITSGYVITFTVEVQEF